MTEAGTDEWCADGHLYTDGDHDSPLRFFAEAQFRLARQSADSCSRPHDFCPVPPAVVRTARSPRGGVAR